MRTRDGGTDRTVMNKHIINLTSRVGFTEKTLNAATGRRIAVNHRLVG